MLFNLLVQLSYTLHVQLIFAPEVSESLLRVRLKVLRKVLSIIDKLLEIINVGIKGLLYSFIFYLKKNAFVLQLRNVTFGS